jgi:uncharacterized membrane protein
MKTRHLILLLLWGAVGLQCLYYYPRLPQIVAAHFDGVGKANGWSSKQSFFAVFLILDAVMSLVFFVLPRTLRRTPESFINIPHRDYWLSPQRKEQALAILEQEINWFGIAILIMLLWTLQLTINANLGDGALQADQMWILLGGFFAFTGIWLVRLYRRFRVPP